MTDPATPSPDLKVVQLNDLMVVARYKDVLRANGFSFGGIATKRTAILAALRDSAKVALESKDYDLCISITNVLKEHDFG